jgi:putative thioredoxin
MIMEPSEFAFDVGEADFDRKVLEVSRQVPVVVDFWAPWCGPCRTLKPLLEKLAAEYGGRFLLARVNSDEAPALSRRYQVRSIPSVKAFVGGRVVDEFVGALPEGAVREFLDRLQPSPADRLHAAAGELVQLGRRSEAIALLQQAMAADPGHEESRLALAELQWLDGNPDAASTTLEYPFADASDRVQALRAKIALAAAAGDEGVLRQAVAAQPGSPAARLALGRALAARGAYDEALAELLESVRLDRQLDDQLARRTILQLFDLLAADPQHDDLVRSYRRALATALN